MWADAGQQTIPSMRSFADALAVHGELRRRDGVVIRIR